MRFFSLIIFLFSSLVFPQEYLVSSGAVPVDNGYDYRVTNEEPFPITMRVDFKLKNLKANSTRRIFVIPPDVVDFKVLELRMIKRDAYGYDANAEFIIGHQENTNLPSSFNYHLPYAQRASYRVSQGSNSNGTHHGKYAIDFSMPVGTPIHAARAGIVVGVRQDQSLGCAKPQCLEYANYIKILHNDGTIGEYAHLKVNGSLVRKGDQVAANEPIGYSGNTGWTTGPHLHFTVYRPQFNGRNRTLPVNFRVGNSTAGIELKENQQYRKP